MATWYNTELFHVNGKSMKFYPKGYNKAEFRSITKIIEAYGGKLSQPSGDTIIFTEQDYPVDFQQCYYVKYFRDCIVANELLDLERYKLPLNANHLKLEDESSNDEHMEVKSDKTSGSDELNIKHFGKLTGHYSKSEDRKIMKYIISKNLISRSASIYVWEAIENEKIVNRPAKSLQDHFRRKLIYEYEEYTRNAAACREFEKILESRGESKKSIYQKCPRAKWDDEENQILMDYIVRNKLIYRMKNRATCREITEKAGLKHVRTVYSVRSQIRTLLKCNYKKYVTDPQALREIAIIKGDN